MKKLYVITCPKCKKARQVKYQEHYRVKMRGSTGLCMDCRKPIYTEGDFFITCPECNKKRQVTRQNYMSFMNESASGRCRSCGIKAAIRKQIKRKKTKTIECRGCTLTVARGDRINSSTRCEKFKTCRHRSECLHVLFKLNWSGFTADCRGFEAKDYREPLDQIKLQI